MSDELNKKLLIAVKISSMEAVKNLLLEGADPLAKDGDGKTALDWAKVISDETAICNCLENCALSFAKLQEKKKKKGSHATPPQ